MTEKTRTIVVEQGLAGEQAMLFLATLKGASFANVQQLVLDVRKVSELDASGVAVLVRLYSQLRQRGIPLSIENASETFASELKRVALTAVVPVSVRVVRERRPSVHPLPA